MLAIGPGRNKAIIAMMSVTVVGLNSLRYLVIPLPPSWNSPMVSPLSQMLKSFLSSIGIFSISISTPLLFLTSSTELPRVDKFLIPQKVHFEQSHFFHRIHIVLSDYFSPFGSNCNGTKSVKSVGEMTTPAACTEMCLAPPSIFWRYLLFL